MYRQTYHIRMSDDLVRRIYETSAAAAMGKALVENPGQTVLECWAGMPNNLADLTGRITYQVPRHEAMGPRPVRKREAPAPCELFDDKQVLEESNKARAKAGLGTIDHEYT
jgi:hypothetical protein